MNYTHYVGIDMSKDSFHAAFDVRTVRQFKATEKGIAEFKQYLIRIGYTPELTALAVESTGVYHLPLAVSLKEDGWPIYIINALITSQMIKAGLRRVKNDSKDARVIREAIILGKGYLFTDTEETLIMKTLVSERAAIVRSRSDMKRRVHAHGVRTLMYTTKAHDPFTSIITSMTESVHIIDRMLRKYQTDTQKLLRTIPGIGEHSTAALVAFVGDIQRFPNRQTLVAFVGLDPRVYQSGTSVHGKGFISKRGNAILRHTLFMCANVAIREDTELRTFADRKRAEGKHHFAVLNAVARKLVCRVYAVWERGTPFERR